MCFVNVRLFIISHYNTLLVVCVWLSFFKQAYRIVELVHEQYKHMQLLFTFDNRSVLVCTLRGKQHNFSKMCKKS